MLSDSSLWVVKSVLVCAVGFDRAGFEGAYGWVWLRGALGVWGVRGLRLLYIRGLRRRRLRLRVRLRGFFLLCVACS